MNVADVVVLMATRARYNYKQQIRKRLKLIIIKNVSIRTV